MNFQSSTTERNLFIQAREALLAAGVSAQAYDGATNTQSTLRLIQPLSAGVSTISFPVLANQPGSAGVVRPDEIRLTQQNAFFVSKMQVYLFNGTSATDIAVQPSTYPNVIKFPIGGAIPAPLNTFYRGSLRCVIDNHVVINNLMLSRFLKVPRTQQGATPVILDQFDGADLNPIEPNIVFGGLFDIQLSINMSEGIPADKLDAFTYIQIDCDGILSQNVQLGAK